MKVFEKNKFGEKNLNGKIVTRCNRCQPPQLKKKLNEILQQELGDEYLSLTAHFLYHIDEKAKMIVRLAEEKERKRLADLNKFNIYAEDKHKYELKPQYLPSVIVKNILSFVPLRDHIAELKSIFGFDKLPNTHALIGG